MIDLAILLPLPVMFFALGLAAGLLRSDLSVPEAVAKGLSLYLMMAIGLKGGIAVGVALSFLMPVPAFALLRGLTRLDRETAAAVAGHYGSVSVVTFAAAVGVLNAAGITYEGFMPAILAAMETPAILTALLLARGGAVGAPSRAPRGHLLREVLLNGSVVLLLGSFAIGWAAGVPARPQLAPFIEGLW
ncbi:MAG: sodium-dependent bicarbonate transport family permease, partial [Pseudomonadota bacterium]